MAAAPCRHRPTPLLHLIDDGAADHRQHVASAAVYDLASVIALVTVSREHLRSWPTILASLLMGCGIAAMHYIGMAAMRLPARAHYDPTMVGASVVLAVGIFGDAQPGA